MLNEAQRVCFIGKKCQKIGEDKLLDQGGYLRTGYNKIYRLKPGHLSY